ncbi:hypothetical protein [Streptomyces sp. NPDC001530]|uniref:hypothetical protein n=1 Tax=Streptomyces sp. NPDC001530 TaxID=3364582 RepID=UPI00368121E7
MRTRTASIAAAAAVAALALSACAGQNTESKSNSGTQAGTKVQGAPVRAVADMSLPLDAYQLSPEEYEKSQQATWALVNPCMNDLGFKDFTFKPAPVADGLEDHEDLRYGTYNITEAGKYGYRPAFTQSSSLAARSGEVGGKEPKFTAEEEAALDGVSAERTGGALKRVTKTAAGETIPKDGCYGQALGKVTDGKADTYLNDTLVEELDGQSYEKSLTEPKTQAAFASWSACMKQKGFSYKSPIDANNDPRWTGDTPSKDEIATATADAQCKEKTSLLTVWHSAEAGIQKNLIAAHSDELASVRAVKVATVANSDKAL